MNMITRLGTVDPDLVTWGTHLSTTQRKAVACAVAQWACYKSNIASLLGEGQLQLMLHPTYSATQENRDMLSNKVDELDEKYFATVDQPDNASDRLPLFEQARAIASLLYAFDAEDILSFCDALYEAQAVTDDAKEFHELFNLC